MRLGKKTAALTLWGLLAAGCGDPRVVRPSGAPADDESAGAGGTTGTSTRVSITSNPTTGQPLAETQFASSPVSTPLIAGSSAGGTSGTGPAGPPFGTSTLCGDSIVGPTEECDDGDEGSDACTAACQTRDEAATANVVGSSTERYLGAGRHPVSGLDQGFATTLVEFPDGEPVVGASLFDIWGKRKQHVVVSDGAFPIEQSNPVVAALPNGNYAVAWTDFNADGADLGIALRSVNADGSLGPLQVANQNAEFTQQNPDLLWTGSQLVATWEDFSDATNGPDLRYRLFDASLTPLSDEQTLAATSKPEAAVALAAFNGSFAAAYRESAPDGSETVVVSAAGKTFRFGPVFGGPPEDRPALTALDATHLLLVFSAGTDPGAIGLYNTPRLRYSLIDTASAVAPVFASLDPVDDLYSTDLQVSQLSPAIASGGDGAYLSWRTEARPNDGAGDQIWLKLLRWTPTLETKLVTSEREVLLPRACEASVGDQRTPALARVELPPSGALAFAWDDYSHSQPNAGDPDVVVHYAPLHPGSATDLKLVAETWTGTTGDPWPARWSHFATAYTSLPTTIKSNQGQVLWSTGTGTEIAYVNDHKALDVDMTTRVRFSGNSTYGGFVTRYQEGAAPSYIFGRVSTATSDTWTIGAVIDGGNPLTIANGPVLTTGSPAWMFTVWAPQMDFWMRFRLTTNADNSIHTQLKLWLVDLPEPSSWTIDGSTSNTQILARFGQTAGRFGLLAKEAVATRSTTFDDFRATFYEGSTHGDPSLTPASTPLLRGLWLERECQPGTPCARMQGCCTQDSECTTGNTCQAARNYGLGSHAPTCAPAHCANHVLDADETRVDCGGADCRACSSGCSSAARGAAGYSTPTCLGDAGDADCSTNADCLPGLVCGQERGFHYGWAQGTDVCMPEYCADRVQDGDEVGVDWGGLCGSQRCANSPNGGYQHCTVSCPCPKGEGACTYYDECQPGLDCVGKGAQFNIAGNVCIPPHCHNLIKDADETKVDCGGVDCGTNCP